MNEVYTMKNKQDWDTQKAKIYQANKVRIDYDNDYKWKNWYEWEDFFHAGMWGGYNDSVYHYNFEESIQDTEFTRIKKHLIKKRLERDSEAPAQLLAGWLYGISDQTIDLRDQLLECFEPTEKLTNKVYRAMRLWHKGDKEDGDKAWHFAEKQYELAL